MMSAVKVYPDENVMSNPRTEYRMFLAFRFNEFVLHAQVKKCKPTIVHGRGAHFT